MFLGYFTIIYNLLLSMDWGGVENKVEVRTGVLTKQLHLSLFFKLHEGNFQKNFLPYKLNPFSPPPVPLLLTKSSS